MHKIFLDIGNSLVKWATVIDDEYVHQQSISLTDLIESNLHCIEENGLPDEVYISSVADASNVDILKLLIQDKWQVFPIQLAAQQQCCGLINGYDRFDQLGDDRWFAMQGAISISTDPVIVIDAGTAMTIDAVIDGQHKGGFIVPGLNSMRTVLSTSTADLADYSDTFLDSEQYNSIEALATNTDSAILGGTLYMAAAFLNQLIVDLNSQFDTVFKVLLTGGEAIELAGLLDGDYEYVPDLVLQGMVNVEEFVKK